MRNIDFEPVLGAVVGDMVGSMYEFCNVKTTDFDMFPYGSKPTDDSVMTLAVAKWLMEDKAHTHQTLVRQLQTMTLMSHVRGSVPVAIRAFLDGNDFEEVVRLAISVGGDSDTIGAMAGAIASCVYPIPEQIRVETRKRMPKDLRDTNDAFLDFVKHRPAPIYIEPISI